MLRKKLSLSECQIKASSDSGRFEGYASTFGNVDSYNDTIARGAYTKTLAERGLPKMFFNHDSFSLPVGKYLDAKQDEVGLFVVGELTMEASFSKDLHAGMKHGTVDGLSIGYRIPKGGQEERSDGVNVLKEIDLIEVSPVTMPADQHARIDLNSVKYEALQEIQTERDLEQFMREALNCSKGLSAALLARVRSVYPSGEPAPDNTKAREAAAVAQLLERFTLKT